MEVRIKAIATFIAGVSISAGSPRTALAFGEPDPASAPITIAGVNCAAGLAAAVDGSIFANATAFDGSRRVYKFTGRGSVDTSWGGSGYISLATTAAGVTSLATRPYGELIAIPPGDTAMRFTASGAIAATYQANGGGLGGFAYEPDGSAVAVTTITPIGLGNQYLGFIRFLPDGARDYTFGPQGVAGIVNYLEGVYAWSLLPDGSLEAGLQAVDGSGKVSVGLRRYPIASMAEGAPVTGRLLPQPGIAGSTGPGVDPSGNVYFAVAPPSTLASEAHVKLFRFRPDGQLDTTFGESNALFPFAGNTTDYGHVGVKALWQSASGEWNVVIEASRSAMGAPYVLEDTTRLVRYRADGSPDPQFAQMSVFDDHGFWPVVRMVDGRLVHMTGTTGCTIERALGDAPATGTMVEYYKASADHYFMTLEGAESVLLDETAAGQGWTRTGRSFGAWMPSTLAGTTRLCRFYGDLESGPDSHFYTPEGSECDGLKALDASTPHGQSAWRFEGYAGNVVVPVAGACPVNLAPVYRLYNRGFEKGGVPNHRYTTDTTLYQQMQSQGWGGEGIAFCVPPAPNNT